VWDVNISLKKDQTGGPFRARFRERWAYLNLKDEKQQENGWNYLMKTFTICTILLQRLRRSLYSCRSLSRFEILDSKRDQQTSTRFEVSTAVTMMIIIFWESYTEPHGVISQKMIIIKHRQVLSLSLSHTHTHTSQFNNEKCVNHTWWWPYKGRNM
jgi:hypothetical protein